MCFCKLLTRSSVAMQDVRYACLASIFGLAMLMPPWRTGSERRSLRSIAVVDRLFEKGRG